MRRRAATAWLQAVLYAAFASGAVHAAEPPAVPFPFTVDEDALAGAPDRSSLNRPLAAADRMVVRDGHFYRVGADGKPGTGDDSRLRLFGANLSFGTNFPDQDQALRLAKRLRKAGFNAVRLHHMDFAPGQEDPPRSILTDGPYPSLNPQAVDRLRHFIDVLAAQGIYTNLNLYVSYRFRPEVDGVPDFGTPDNRLPIGASVHVYHPRMVALQIQYARDLIGALGLQGHPALAMVEISNEASLLASWVRQRWYEQALPEPYEPVLRGLWNAWLQARYGSLEAACEAWGDCLREPGGELALPTPEQASRSAGRIEHLIARVQAKLNAWLPSNGPSRPLEEENPRLHDFLAFLVETDRAYLDRLRDVIKAETDSAMPVAGTQMSYGDVLNFDSHAGMDYIDDHQYIDHPFFPAGSSAQRDWSIRRLSLTGGDMDVLSRLAFRRDSRKPFVLSEFNQPFPNPRGAEILPVAAAFAALQDWDGLFFFDYLDSGWPESPANFTLSGDWGKYALAGQSAQIFRLGWVPPLATRLDFPLPLAARMGIAASGRHDGWERAYAQAGVLPGDTWRYRFYTDVQATVFGPVEKPPIAAAQTAAVYQPEARRLTLETPQALGYFGMLDARWRGTDAFEARRTGQQESASDLLLTSLDGSPVAQSAHLLLTVGSATVGTQPGSMPPRPKRLQRYKDTMDKWTLEPDPDQPQSPSGARHAQAPAWLARPAQCVRWRGQAAAATVYPLDEQGRRQPALAPTQWGQEDGLLTLDLSGRGDGGAALSPWYEVVLDPALPARAGPVPACAGTESSR